jgi:hypothetical protein
LLGSVSVFGLCAADASRQLTRHRSVSAGRGIKTVSPGLSRGHLSRHPGLCQRASRLAHLRRFCSGVDPDRAPVVPQRTLRRGARSNGVRLGLHHHRSLFVTLPVGPVPPPQKRRQAAYAAGSARQIPKPVVLVDTREQRPFEFTRHRNWIAGTQRQKLSVGDTASKA